MPSDLDKVVDLLVTEAHVDQAEKLATMAHITARAFRIMMAVQEEMASDEAEQFLEEGDP